MKQLAMIIACLIAAGSAMAQSAGSDIKYCDVNGDNEVDITDVNIMLNVILDKIDASLYGTRADIDKNGQTDITDVNVLINEILGRNTVTDLSDANTYRQLNMPLVEVCTVDGEMPACDFVDHPVGSYGHSITNATKVQGRLTVTLMGDTLYDSGEYLQGLSGMTIKINGNTSARDECKPYKIKLQQKADLLARDDSIYNDKEWRLIKDDQHLNTMFGLKVNELLGLQWTPQGQFCNLFINGTYQGVYILIENVKRNTKCRLDVSKTGYIIERDAYWWNEDVYFKSGYFNDGRYGWTFKEPDADEITPEQIEYIQQCVNEAEKSIENGTYPDLIDVPSFASWLLAHDILGTWDCGGSNLYLTKYDNTAESKLTMGCLWDFDSNRAVGTRSFSRYHTASDFYYTLLFTSSNDAFTKAYCQKWEEIRNTIGDQLDTFLDTFLETPTAQALSTSRKYYSILKGSAPYSTPLSNVNAIKEYLAEHLQWMDKVVEAINRDIHATFTRPSHRSRGSH